MTGREFDFLGEDAIVLEVAADDTESVLIEDIPIGTECTVTEAENGLFSTVVIPEDGTVTIDADGEEVEFTNTRLTGGLTITKNAVGGSGTFTFEVDCDGTDFDFRVRAPSSSTSARATPWRFSSTSIPTGTECTVTEAGIPAV